VTIICHNDDLSLTSLFTNRVYLIEEIKQILLKIYFIPILLTFMNLVALYQKQSQAKLELNSSL
jgi:hypothetical protein